MHLGKASGQHEVAILALRRFDSKTPRAKFCHERRSTSEDASLPIPLRKLNLSDFLIEDRL
jgi:hypothetical protein